MDLTTALDFARSHRNGVLTTGITKAVGLASGHAAGAVVTGVELRPTA